MLRAHGLDGEMSTPPTLLTGYGIPLPCCLLSARAAVGRHFYPRTHPVLTENPEGIPQDPHTHRTPTSYIPIPFVSLCIPVFSLQEAYFNLLFVTLTVGYYMMYVLRGSVCD